MKTILLISGLALGLVPAAANAEVTESQVWTETYAVSTTTPRLAISNIWGNVRVRPGPEGKITITVDELRTASDQAMLDRSKEMLKLDTYADTNGVSMTVGDRERQSGYRNHCDSCRVDLQFEVVVPKGTLVDVGTVMDGRIDVAGINGQVSASNVNGPIAVADLQSCDAVESVNGKVDLSFSMAPGQDCNIETINGDVTLNLPPGSGLDVSLDIFNGQVVSEFATDTYAVPAEVKYEQTQGVHRYQIQQSAGLRIEGGGPTFSISSMNGDVRIQQN